MGAINAIGGALWRAGWALGHGLRPVGGERKAHLVSGGIPLAGPFDALIDRASIAKTGQSVTIDRALRVSTVSACSRVISEGVAQMPGNVYERIGERRRRVAAEHPVHHVLHSAPNEWQTPFEWREGTVVHAALTGDAYSFINRVDGEVRELLPLVSTLVEVTQQADWRLAYKVRMPSSGEILMLRRDQVMHLRGPSWNGFTGRMAVREAREAIGLAMATEETHERLFANGARPGGLLTTATMLNEQQQRELREQWERVQGGIENLWKTAIIGGGLEWKPMAMTGVDNQHIETRRFQIEEICRFFRVFPMLVMQADKTATFASAEQFFLAHLVHTLDPWAARLEQAADRDLLTPAERRGGLYVKLNRNALLRGSVRDRAQFYKDMYSIGVYSSNDIRALEDEDERDGGDAYREPMNMEPTSGAAAPAAASPSDGGS